MADAEENQKQGQRLTVGQAASMCGRSEKWVHNLIAAGYIERQGQKGYIPVSIVRGAIAYYEDRLKEASKSATATKATEARTREIELRTAERARRVIPVEDSLAITSEIAQMARAEFSGLPARLTRDLDLRRAMEEAIDDIFARLAGKAAERGEALRSGRVDLDALEEN